ncbi:MAG: hypothetical protein A3D99_02200 [Candidatus Andersenbacteria bacterium RIFCSPHIGHO2_12_FULL_45_11]|uniref:Glutamate--tRNA ligase n=1 Tax=Candidatus Andersenbacteria bacterium RIFCSPHIGHO2_12_FULL_45_11 TaxID=1797281 RepID=A0A1G1X2R3_9BACT|nr:MAG: hypothetical protein A3D99_02200 [Candidatus Andersenbacteria bacterium RIFCSPHIGHO2_12_FULL_45_11]
MPARQAGPLTPLWVGGETPVRVRIAPSPTGNLHVGTARTSLFNELFARHHNGKFIVRIEDTDKERSKPEYEQAILEGLTWLGVTWDEGPDIGGEYGPYRQSERTESYTQALQQLLDTGKAYKEGEAIRLKVEPQTVTFHDLSRGDIAIDTKSFEGDFIIARNINDPVFHLAVVCDDAAMKISHVIRGEDHIHNTAKHILIQKALGYPQPEYAHLPLLLDAQRKKLSKRNQETNLLAYRDMGFLPEAMLNYLALLGWNPGDEREFFTHEELATAFSMERVQKGGAIFSTEKLTAINKHYIRSLSVPELMQRAGISEENDATAKAVALEQERISTLTELPEAIAFASPEWQATYPPSMLVWKKSTAEATKTILADLITKVVQYEKGDFTALQLQEYLIAWIDSGGLGRGDVLWPMRVALTGREHSPGPFEIAEVVGKNETIRRLTAARDIL